jgi:glycosyltransferase involved in cell wall biosynthesis
MIQVTIIVPVYNTPIPYLRKCLDSLRSQKLTDTEVIVVDDGSTKNEISHFCDQYSDCFKIVHKKNEGVSVARNLGITLAHGKWITFVDADDWVEPSMLSDMLTVANTHTTLSDIIICDCIVEFENASKENSFFSQNEEFVWGMDSKIHTLLQIMGKNKYYNPKFIAVGVPWAKLYRTAFLHKNNLHFNPELRRMQDNIFNLYAFYCAKNVLYTNKKLYHYRKFENSTSNKYSPNVVRDFEKVLRESDKFVKFSNLGEVMQQAQYSRIIQSIHSYSKFWIFNRSNPSSFNEMNKELKQIIKEPLYNNAIKRVNPRSMPVSLLLFYLFLKLHAGKVIQLLVNFEGRTSKNQS